MNSTDIRNIIKEATLCYSSREKARYVGHYAVDMVKYAKLFSPNEILSVLVNTDVSTGEGIHWICVSVDLRGPEKYAFVFDSLARDLKQYPILHQYLCSLDLDYIMRNSTPIQNKKVDSCGLFAIYYIILIMKDGADIGEILGTFEPSDSLLNDCALLENMYKFLSCTESPNLINDLRDTISLCDVTNPK